MIVFYQLELFFGDQPRALARWPNAGGWTRIAGVPEGTSQDACPGRKPGQLDAGFHYEGNRPMRWHDASDLEIERLNVALW